MTEKKRPPFVLVIMADAQGCGYHRCQVPLAALAEAGVVDGRIDMQVWPDHVVEAAAPDVIVWQRQVDEGVLDAMKRWRALLPDALFVYELDDYLGGIPKASFHSGFMPPDLESRVARGLALCDRATTTTDRLAVWMRGLGAADVRVVPNMIPAAKVREREPRQGGRLRVGFAGGLSHDGDLRLIRPAMEAIGDDVEWVLFGMNMEDAPVRVEYHEGVATTAYMDAMARLDVDLYLAPLEDNEFNRCKSNLRLVEAGAAGACVIAQRLEPYLTSAPPVFAYADSPDDWTREIRRFAGSTVGERRKSANALRSWVGRHYVLERGIPTRMDAWLPDGPHWRPTVNRNHPCGQAIVASAEETDGLVERMPFLRRLRHETDLEAACVRAAADNVSLLWLRPSVNMGESTWNAMVAALSQAPTVASATPLGSDGSNAFPKMDEWMPMSAEHVRGMESVVVKELRQRRLSVVTPSGPAVLLSATALSMLGAPDVAGCDGNEEQAILEWGLRAASREWKHMQACDGFASSLAPPPPPTQKAALRFQARGWGARLQSSSEPLTPEERERVELRQLGAQWGCPRPGSMGFGVDYASWKVLTDARRDRSCLDRNEFDGAVVVSEVTFGHGGVPVADWIVPVDDSIRLYPDALNELAAAIARAPEGVMVVYADHDTRTAEGQLLPEFKPDFDLELLLAHDYVTPICAIRGDAPVPADRTALFAYVLDIGLQRRAKAFAHVARPLGSMALPTKPEELALDAVARQAVVEDRLGDSARVKGHRHVPGCLSVVRDWRGEIENAPLVSIVIPTLGGGWLLQPCVNTLRQHTDYPNYEVIVVQNGERMEPELGDAANDPRVRVVRWDGPFNWSAINNMAIRDHAKGKFVVALNDDVTTVSKGWLHALLGQAVVPDVGAVGAKLIHPMGIVQHVGVLCHNGIAAHMHKGLPNGQPGQLGRAFLTHEASAVTGACMMFSRAAFDAVGGFDEDMPRNYNDTDFCMRLREAGYRNVVETAAEMLHPEGSSRPDQMSKESLALLARENKAFARRHPGPDPYWNPNLALTLVHGGVMVRGGNGDVLHWDDAVPDKDATRVLLVNDLPGQKGRALDVVRRGEVPMAADLSGFALRLVSPAARNTPPWDVRDPARMAEGLRLLGVDVVVLRSLIGSAGAASPVESLLCLASLGVKVEVDPVEDWTVYPIDGQGTREFGFVDRKAWVRAYGELTATKVAAMEA